MKKYAAAYHDCNGQALKPHKPERNLVIAGRREILKLSHTVGTVYVDWNNIKSRWLAKNGQIQGPWK